MTPAEKQKEIAVAFARYFNHEVSKVSHITSRLLIILYENWLLTEEGKRLTAEDRSEPEEPAINILIKISKQLDRMEGKRPMEMPIKDAKA
jgi:hypothetical protein